MPTGETMRIMYSVRETAANTIIRGYIMLATIPQGTIPMTIVITDCQSTVETRLVDQVSGNTLKTNYHNDIDSAVSFAEQFNPDRIEFDTL